MRFRFIITSALLLLAALNGCGSSKKTSATAVSLLSDAATTGDATVPSALQPVRYRFVELNASLLATSAQTRLTLNLFPDTTYTAVQDSFVLDADGVAEWQGHLDGVADSEVSFAHDGTVATGVIRLPGHDYVISDTAGPHYVAELDMTKDFPETDPIDIPAARLPLRARQTNVAADDGSTVDILIVWTPAARIQAGGVDQIKSTAGLAVEAANRCYANSQIPLKMRLVGMAETNYDETGFDGSETLGRLHDPSDGFMDDVPPLRDAYAADLVTLLTASTQTAGLAYTYNASYLPDHDFSANAYALVRFDLAASYYTLAHECGHNMGCMHNKANASRPAFVAWGYGFTSAAFRTVMSYGGAGVGERIDYFSNPSVRYQGQATGVDGESNNAKLINDQRQTVCNWRRSASATRPIGS